MVSYILLDINILACVCRVQNGIGGYNLLDTNGLAYGRKAVCALACTVQNGFILLQVIISRKL